GAVRAERLVPALWALVIWVVLLNGGTLAINSVFDKDEGDIGYLIAPPPIPKYLLLFSTTLLVGGQLLAFTLPPAFRIVYALCFAMSVLYSVPPFRFKAVAGVDWLINMWGFGSFTPFATWAATGRSLDLGHALLLLGFCPLFAGLYPLTQLYQLDEDRRRGDRTLALILGMRRSLGVAIACVLVAFALFVWAAVVLGAGTSAATLGVALAVWLGVLAPWYARHAGFTPVEHQRGMYRALTAWAVTAGIAVSLVRGRLTGGRHVEGIAGAAAIGLWGTVVFTAIDIVLLRPFKAYPWTWDAVGGGSTWWYLPIWWMLGTALAWTGAIVTADRAARGDPALVRAATPTVGGAVLLAAV